MSRTFRLIAMLLTALCGAVASPLAAQDGPPPEVRAMIDATVAMLRGTDDSTLTVFVEKTVAPSYRETFTGTELADHLKALRHVVANGDGSVAVRGAPGSVLVMFAADGSAQIRLEWNDDNLVTRLVDESGGG